MSEALLMGLAVAPGDEVLQAALLAGYAVGAEHVREHAPTVQTIAIAYMVDLAKQGIRPEAWLQLLFRFVDGLSEQFEATLRRLGHVEGWMNTRAALYHIGDDCPVVQALFCLRRQPNDYVAAVELAAQTRAHSLVSAMSALLLGVEAIPADLQRCNRAAVQQMSQILERVGKNYG